MSPLSSGSKNKQETSVKAGGKQITWLAEISVYIGNRRDMKTASLLPLARL
jgi:hypothetical protein